MDTSTSAVTLQTIYHEVLGDFANHQAFMWKHRGGFVHFIQTAVAHNLLDQRFTRKLFRLERLSYALDPTRDSLLNNMVLDQLLKNELLKDGLNLIEVPQYYWMRQAMMKAVDADNPTRTALKLYDSLSKEAVVYRRAYPATIFNTQRLLFGVSQKVNQASTLPVDEHYYKHGWTILDKFVANEFEAIRLQEDFINSLDSTRLIWHQRFSKRIQLAKADQIPVCDDVVTSNFQVLHFDMGHPFVESNGQLLVTQVGIYLPATIHYPVTARTRLVELDGLLAHLHVTPKQIEEKLITYVKAYGDGWTGHNTYRLACFARFIDALNTRHELETLIDQPVGQWFQTKNKLDEASAHQKEIAYYYKNGININKLEHHIALKPGQLLILDNIRVIHGRIGTRKRKELFNFMFGVEAIAPEDVTALRHAICALVV